MVLGLLACTLANAADGKLGIFTADSDIGETPQKGSAGFDPSTGEYRVTGGGDNMWKSADAFHFVWKKMSGDFTLTADFRFLGTGAVAHRKAALIVRQNLEPGSAYADVARHGDGLTSLQFRPAAGALTEAVRSEVNGPVQIRIERRGNRFTMYAAKAGEDLKAAGPITVVLKDPVYAGLAVCSHDANVLETAVFWNVKFGPVVTDDRAR